MTMLQYVAAIATAVSILICSTPVKAEPAAVAARAAAPSVQFVRIDDDVRISNRGELGADAVYHLTRDEQALLKKALFRSAKVLG